MILKSPTCLTCGYSWPAGTNGNHSCVSLLLRKVEILEARHIALDIERRVYIAEIESLEAKCQRLEGELQTSRDLCDEIRKSESSLRAELTLRYH